MSYITTLPSEDGGSGINKPDDNNDKNIIADLTSKNQHLESLLQKNSGVQSLVRIEKELYECKINHEKEVNKLLAECRLKYEVKEKSYNEKICFLEEKNRNLENQLHLMKTSSSASVSASSPYFSVSYNTSNNTGFVNTNITQEEVNRYREEIQRVSTDLDRYKRNVLELETQLRCEKLNSESTISLLKRQNHDEVYKLKREIESLHHEKIKNIGI